MTSDHKKPGVAFWATVAVVVVLVGYPLSFGPWCWLNVMEDTGGPVSTPTSFYRPIVWIWYRSPSAIDSVIGWYASLASNSNLAPGMEDDGTFCVVSGFP